MLKISIPSDYRYDAICNDLLQPFSQKRKTNDIENACISLDFSRRVKIRGEKVKVMEPCIRPRTKTREPERV